MSVAHAPAPEHATDRWELVRFFAVLVLFWSSLYLFVPVLAPFAQNRGASLNTVGILISAYGFSQLLLRIPLGVWSDRIGKRKPFITYGFLAAFAGAVGLALVPSPTAMILFRALTGVCASMWVMITVMYAARFEPSQTARAMGLAFMATNLTQLASTLAGGLLADTWGWEAPFILAALLAALGLFVARTLRERPTQSSPPKVRELADMGRDRALLTVSLLAALLQTLPFMTIYGFTTVFAVELGASPTQLGILSFASGTALAAASYFAGRSLVPRFGSKATIVAGFALAAVSVLLFPLANGVATLVVLQMCVSLGTGSAFPTLMALSIQTVPEERRGTAMGFFQSLYSLGMFGGPVIGGLLGGALGLSAIFAGAGLLAAIGALGAVRFIRSATTA